MVVRFKITYAIAPTLLKLWVLTLCMAKCTRYNDYVIKFVSDLRQVGDFLGVLWFPPRYNWNIVESGVTHHKPNLFSKLRIVTGIYNKDMYTYLPTPESQKSAVYLL
jgi:hypothetical protein